MAPTATTSAGVLAGVTTEDGASFRGVHYATAARFAAPSPVEPWDGVVPADRVGPAAPQRITTDPLIPDMGVAEIGEDCLRAQIWTPSTEGARPVLVWIPGGRYQIGGAGLATYDGGRLSAEGDLVVIGLNYRLGALGFLATDGVPSNLGLRDLIAALEWIRAEVAAFGGDPANITLIGESAGAGAITHLLASPAAQGLFDAAIVASAAPGATLDAAAARSVAAEFLSAAGVDDAAALAAVDLDDLLAAQATADAAVLATVGMMPFHPWIDGDLLTEGPLDAALAPVPLVIGTTADEMALFRDQVPDLPEEFAIGWLTAKCAAFSDDPAAAAAAGFAACDGALVDAIADTDLHVPAGLLADSHAARGLPVWRYLFGWEAPRIGAAHATDLPFHFGTLDVADWRSVLGADGDRSSAADTLSAAMRAAWAAFCHTGVPACAPIGAWPRHDPVARTATLLASPVVTAADVGGPHFRAWTLASSTPPKPRN
ncbi:MAG: carboxylesterase family protein [Acidimicrobiales bacterium]